MADLQIARRGEQPLERDQLVPQLGELVREGRPRSASAAISSSQRAAPTGSLYHGSTGRASDSERTR